MPLIGTSTSASAKGYGMLASGYPVAGNPSFNNVSLLLHGDGTNGAQNNTFLDSSTNALTVTRSGSTTQGSFNPYGPNGWSGYFSSSYLSIPNSTSLQLGSSDFCIECWVNFTSTTGNQRIISQSDSNYEFAFYSVGGSVTAYSFTSTGTQIFAISMGSLSIGQWYHIACIRSGSNVRAYVNGSQVGSTASGIGTIDARTGGWKIGASYTGTETFNGYISNARIVKGSDVYGTGSTITVPTAPLTAITNTSLLTLQDNRFKDNSTNNFTLTASGSPQIQPVSPFVSGIDYNPATHGGSAYFDTGSLTVNSTNVSVGSGDFTLEFLHYYDSSLTSMTLLDSRSDTGGSVGFALTIDNTNISIYTQSGYRINGTRPTANQWNHIALVRSGNNHNIYVNGTSTGTTYTAANNYSSTRVLIGENFSGGQLTKTYFSNLRLIKGTAVVPTPATLPTAPLTNIAGTALLLNFTNAGIFDSSAKNNLITAGSAQVSSAQVKFGTGSMLFNGTTDYLLSPSSASTSLGSGDFTIEFWINPSSVASESVIVDLRSGSASVGPTVGFSAGGAMYFQTSATSVITGSTLPTSTWTHVAVSRASNNTRLFVNGVQYGSTYSTAYTPTSPARVCIGARDNGTFGLYFNGYIDDFRITKGVAVYTQNFTPYPQAFPNS